MLTLTRQSDAELTIREMCDLLVCPLCAQSFSDPCSLPCQHHFCRVCLDDDVTGKTETLCPTCHVPFWDSSIRTNIALRNIMLAVDKAAQAAQQLGRANKPPSRTTSVRGASAEKECTKEKASAASHPSSVSSQCLSGSILESQELNRFEAQLRTSNAQPATIVMVQPAATSQSLVPDDMFAKPVVPARARRQISSQPTSQPLSVSQESIPASIADSVSQASEPAAARKPVRRANSSVEETHAGKRARSIVDESTEMQTQSSVQSESQNNRPRRTQSNAEPFTSTSVPTTVAPVSLHKYIAFTGIGVAQQKALTAEIASLGGATIEENMSAQTTHVVASSSIIDGARLTKRTSKYMQGVAMRKWVVCPEWITSSAAAKKWLPDADFEIEGDASKGKTLAPKTARQSALPLLSGCRLVITPASFSPYAANEPDPATLSALGTAAGAAVSLLSERDVSGDLQTRAAELIASASLPAAHGRHHKGSTAGPECYVLAGSNSTHLAALADRLAGWPLVAPVWLIDSVSQYQRRPVDEYVFRK